MGAEESRLSLRALAQRLDTLERENAELRGKVATLEGSGARRHADAERLRILRGGSRRTG
jgi:hypothetical protein